MSGQGDGEGSCRACRQERMSVLYSHGTAPSEASRSWPAVMEISWVGLCARRVLYRTPDREHAFAACCGTCWALRDHTLATFCSGCPSVLIASAKMDGEIVSYSDGRGYKHFPIERE